MQDHQQAARAAALKPEAARPWLARALAAGADGALPELCLLASNAFAQEPLAQASYLNRHLGHYGLSPIALREGHRPLSPTNLCPATTGEPMDDGPLVSVLMTVHNAAQRVHAAVQSVLDQTWRHLELIVVDDASDDASWERILASAAGDARIRPLRLPRKLGPFGAKMIGLQHARGSLITCQDADDCSHPEKIARQVAPLRARQQLVATTSCWVRVDDHGRFHARQRWPLLRWNPTSTLFRRDPVLARAGAWDVVRTGADRRIPRTASRPCLASTRFTASASHWPSAATVPTPSPPTSRPVSTPRDARPRARRMAPPGDSGTPACNAGGPPRGCRPAWPSPPRNVRSTHRQACASPSATSKPARTTPVGPASWTRRPTGPPGSRPRRGWPAFPPWRPCCRARYSSTPEAPRATRA